MPRDETKSIRRRRHKLNQTGGHRSHQDGAEHKTFIRWHQPAQRVVDGGGTYRSTFSLSLSSIVLFPVQGNRLKTRPHLKSTYYYTAFPVLAEYTPALAFTIVPRSRLHGPEQCTVLSLLAGDLLVLINSRWLPLLSGCPSSRDSGTTSPHHTEDSFVYIAVLYSFCIGLWRVSCDRLGTRLDLFNWTVLLACTEGLQHSTNHSSVKTHNHFND